MAQSIRDRFKRMFKKSPKAFKPELLNAGEKHLEFKLFVPLSDGVLSHFEWCYKRSDAPWSAQASSWKDVDDAKWRGQPPGKDFVLIVESLEPETAYDIAVRGRSDEALDAGEKQVTLGNKTLALKRISGADLAHFAEQLQSVLKVDDTDGDMQLKVDAESKAIVQGALDELEGSLVTVPLLKSVKVRRLSRTW